MRTDASRTAVLVCQGRAVSDGRVAVGRFGDPVAATLLREDERSLVDRVRDHAVPQGLAARLDYEFVRRCAQMMVPRTVGIDDAVRECPTPQVVILGAGLDARAWRMPELADAVVYEVDHPASQADKRDRLGDREPLARDVVFVSLDFTQDDLPAGLQASGLQADVPTTWIWEGVIPYLTRHQVATTAMTIRAHSAPGSRLVVNYQSPSLRAWLGRALARAMAGLTDRPSPWAGEPPRSRWSPERLAGLLTENAFPPVRDRDLLQLSRELGLDQGVGGLDGSLSSGHVLVADHG